jgi:hypothetical protein
MVREWSEVSMSSPWVNDGASYDLSRTGEIQKAEYAVKVAEQSRFEGRCVPKSKPKTQ